MQIPVEAVPDGAVFAPHHVYVGLFLAYFGARRVDDLWPKSGPWGAEMAVLTAGFSFATIWPFYHLLGATMTLLALFGGLVSVFSRDEFWDDVPRWLTGTVIFGFFIALDDVINHMFGIPTPLDWLFHAVILPLIRAGPETLAFLV